MAAQEAGEPLSCSSDFMSCPPQPENVAGSLQLSMGAGRTPLAHHP